MTDQFIQDRIDATKAAIVAAEQAELDLISGGISSYTIDSGQTRQTVTRNNIASLRLHIEALYNRYATLTRKGVHTARPDW